jgi:uncharacterized protein (DUF2141 family)
MKWILWSVVFGLFCAGTMAYVSCVEAQTPGTPTTPITPPPAKNTDHQLTITVTDVKSTDGQLMISVYSKTDGFPDNPAKATYTAQINPQKPEYTFDLPTGKYVVVVVHDRNKNGKVDKTLIGFPKEPIGLSNHPKIGPGAGKPDFDKAKVDVKENTRLTINLIELGL